MFTRKLVAEITDIEKKYVSILSEVIDYMYTIEIDPKNDSAIFKHLPAMRENFFKLTGYTIEELENDPLLWQEMIHEEDRTMLDEELAKAIAQQDKKIIIDYRIKHKNKDTIRYVKNTFIFTYDKNKQLISYTELIRDITDELHIKELRRAREAQRGFLPKKENLQKNPYLCIDFSYMPLNHVSGDLPFISNTLIGSLNHEVGAFLFDVEGHGPEASSFTLLIRNVAKGLLEKDRHLYWKRPGEFMRVFNSKVDSALKNAPYFLTALYGFFSPNPEDNSVTFSWAKAGSPYPILYDAQGNNAKFLKTKGAPLRLNKEALFEERSITIYPGDRIYLVTDGVLEQEYRPTYKGVLPSLPEFFVRPEAKTIEETIALIEKDLTNKKYAKKKHDDQTILGFQIKPFKENTQ